MAWQEDTVKRLDELIKSGEEVKFDGTAQGWARLTGWHTQAMVALEDLIGPEHTYTQQLVREEKALVSTYGALELLSRLRSDVQNGYLKRMADLISAEVFGNFLEMSEHLLGQGYKDPAASLCGAVLEDGLRRIASNNNVTVTARDDLSSLRSKCAQKGVYNNLVLQQIVSWTTLRNAADHGKFDEYDANQVDLMIQGVRSFLGSHLG